MPAGKTLAAMLLFLFLAPPIFGNALALEREGGEGEKICKCDFTSALLTVSGNDGEKFALASETDGQIGVHAPATALANTPTRVYMQVACTAHDGNKLFEISARSLSSGALDRKLFSLQAVACPKLILRTVARFAYCPSQADFEFELENAGIVTEKGEFSAKVVQGLAEFTPSKFALAPGEKTQVTLSLSLPNQLASLKTSETIEVRAIGRQTVALATVPLVTPLCPSPIPAQFPGAPSPTPVLVSGGLGSVSGENFLTGFFLAGRDGFANWVSGLNKQQLTFPSVAITQEIAVIILLAILLAVGGYAVYKERQTKNEEKKLQEKRRERMARLRKEI